MLALQTSDRSAILSMLNYHCRCIVTWHLLAVNSKSVENFEPSSGDNKEKLSSNIHSEYASDFCHDRKFALRSYLEFLLSFDYPLRVLIPF